MMNEMWLMVMMTQYRCEVVELCAVQREAFLCFPEIPNGVEIALQQQRTLLRAVSNRTARSHFSVNEGASFQSLEMFLILFATSSSEIPSTSLGRTLKISEVTAEGLAAVDVPAGTLNELPEFCTCA